MIFVKPVHKSPAGELPPVTDGLMLWLEMDEGSGLVAGDSSPNSNDANFIDLTEAAWITPGANSSPAALNFAEDGKLETGPMVLRSGDDISICFKYRMNPGDPPQSQPNLLGQNGGSQNNSAFSIEFSQSNAMSLWINSFTAGWSGYVSTYTKEIDSTWHSLVWTHDALEAKLFVDGSLFQTLPAPTVMGNTNTLVIVGKHFNLGGRSYLSDMDDVRLYDRILTDTEISRIAAGTG